MLKLGLFLILALWTHSTFSRPDPEFHATQNKLMKLKQREKTKNVVIMKKTEIEDSDHGHQPNHHKFGHHELPALGIPEHRQQSFHHETSYSAHSTSSEHGGGGGGGSEGTRYQDESKFHSEEKPLVIESPAPGHHADPTHARTLTKNQEEESYHSEETPMTLEVQRPVHHEQKYISRIEVPDEDVEVPVAHRPVGRPVSEEEPRPVQINHELPLAHHAEPSQTELESEPEQVASKSCIDHPPISEHLDPEFQKILMSHRVFILVASDSYLDQMSLTVTGHEFDISHRDGACIRSIWEKKQRRIHGWDQKALLTCTGDFNDITCWRVDKDKNQFGGKTRYTNVWSDGQEFMINVMCDENGRSGWAILSNQRSIDQANLAPLLQTLKNFGYDLSDKVELSFTDGHCIQSIKDDVQEGPCLTGGIPSVNAHDKAKVLQILGSGPLYTPLQSITNVYSTGLIIRGEQLKPEEDLDSVCANYEWRPDSLEMMGFHGRKSVLACDTGDIQAIHCLPDDDASDNKKIYLYNRQYIPIWFNHNSVLMYSCLSTNLKSWALFSQEKTVPRETKRYILARVADYDFDPVKHFESKYDNCPARR